MTRQERYTEAIAFFEEHIPAAETELAFRTPYELLVAVILSAQCTDKRINMITPALFAAYPTPIELAKAEFEDVFPYVRTVSYPNNKTKHIIAMAKLLVEKHSGEVPSDWNALQELPGVGRKTANVIVSVLFDQPAIAVDTHVFRVSQRIGLVNPSKTPLEVEKQLIRHVPKDLQGKFHHWLILHGRYTCVARTPKCSQCGLTYACKYYQKNSVMLK
ncbi:MAG: endonuclease III [Bacteroidota bacterium]|nr:endonuclease III [Bacteroidota bacterium]